MLIGLLGCHGWMLIQSAEATAAIPPARPSAATSLAVAAWSAQTPPPILRMKPRDRARVLAALGGLLILGAALILLAWWGARFTRRYLRRPWPDQRRRKAAAVSEFDWADKPLYDVQNKDTDSDGEDPREG